MKRLQLGGEAESLLGYLEEGGTPLARDDRYMCARFVTTMIINHPEYVPHLSRLASIGLLTEVVDDFIKPTRPETKTNLIIVLDAPIALDYLGCSGSDAKEDLKPVFESLKNIGCSLIVFPVTCEEMTNNLQSMLRLPPTNRHGYTHEAMCRGEVREDYVRAIALDPVRALQRVGIQLRQVDLDQFPNFHVFFNKERYEDFLSSVTWVKEIRPREHDATCMALLMRLRGGKHSSDLLKCGYVFVTRNPYFAERSRAYCLQNRLITSIQQGPVVQQRELATIAWLRTGLDTEERIPRGHLLAACDRVLRTRIEVRDAVASKLKQIKPSDLEQFELLLSDHRCLKALADQTLNDEKAVTNQNVGQLLDIMRKSTASEVRNEYEQKLRDAQRQVQELQDQLAKLTREHRTPQEVEPPSNPQPSPKKSSLLQQRRRYLLGSTSLCDRGSV